MWQERLSTENMAGDGKVSSWEDLLAYTLVGLPVLAVVFALLLWYKSSWSSSDIQGKGKWAKRKVHGGGHLVRKRRLPPPRRVRALSFFEFPRPPCMALIVRANCSTVHLLPPLLAKGN